jgi:hypothetical protein
MSRQFHLDNCVQSAWRGDDGGQERGDGLRDRHCVCPRADVSEGQDKPVVYATRRGAGPPVHLRVTPAEVREIRLWRCSLPMSASRVHTHVGFANSIT